MNKLKCIFFFAFMVFVLSFSVKAQRQYSLIIELTGEHNPEIFKKNQYKKAFNDTISRFSELNTFIAGIISEGYLTASIDSILTDSITLKAFLNPGKLYKWAQLSKGNIENEVLNDVGWNRKKFTNKPLKIYQFIKLNEKILEIYENTGYPFASLTLDSIVASDSTLKASYNLEKNSLITIDSIIIKGKLRLSEKFIFHYLDINKGMLYNEAKISQISARIKELQFVKEVKPFHVVFFREKAKLLLYLEKKKNSRFDGILGVAPNNQTNGKLVLTGELNLELENAFAKAEQLSLKWRKLQLSSQDLKMNFVYPYIFNLPFGADGKFKLYKNDTLYLTLSGTIGLRYVLRGTDYFKGFYENTSSIMLNATAYKNAVKLPDFADVSANLYGIELHKTGVDFLYNPRKGYTALVSIAAGNRKIKKNTTFNDSLYSGIKLNTVQYKTEFNAAYYKSLSQNLVLKAGVNGAAIFADKLFENEMFLFGGLNTLRGFDEESISASEYIIPYLEFRLLFEEKSNVFLFYNQAYYRKKLSDSIVKDNPYGFGVGVNFETKAGIFTLSYALGKQFSNPIDFKAAKIHFGIISIF